MIVWLASYPRSGNTFLRTVLHSVYGLPTFSLYDEDPPPEMQRVLGCGGAIGDLPTAHAAPETRYVKTHELPGEDQASAMYIVRDGRDALVSYAHYIHRYDRGELDVGREVMLETLRALIERDEWFGGWGHHVDSWLERPNTMVMKFEQLITAPVETVDCALRAARQVVQRGARAAPTFDELHALVPDFFTRGQVGRWRTEMPPDIENLFWQRHGARMERLGYVRVPPDGAR